MLIILKARPSCRWNRRNRLKYLDILYELYYTSLANGQDALSLQQPQTVSNIEPELLAESSSGPATSAPTSASETPPTLALLNIQRKRRRGREGTSMLQKTGATETSNNSETLEGMRILAKARLEAAEIVASATAAAAPKNPVPEALNILFRDFTNEPRKLTSANMQTAINFLRVHDNATVFLALSDQHGMEEHRDRWLEMQAGVKVFQE